MVRVHIWEKDNSEFTAKLNGLVNQSVAISSGTETPEPADFDTLVCGVPDRELIEASPKLKRLIIPWSGLPKKTRELMQGFPDIAIHNIHHNRVAVAEMAIALMIGSAKQIIPAHNALCRDDWTIRYEDNHGILQLAGRRALIVGYGAIGKEIGLRLKSFGVRVTGLNTSGDGAEEIPLHPITDLKNLLPTTDLLFLSLPLTPDTTDLIDAPELSLLPHDAILINISRGAIINETALDDCLRKGKIRAGLDVWYNYPDSKTARSKTAPSQYRWADLPNVIMTPHIAGHSDQSELMRAEAIASLLNLASEGKRLPNRVDLKLGY